MSGIKNINCPNCDHKFDVEDVLASKLEESIKEKYQARQNDAEKRLKDKLFELESREEEFKKKKKNENEIFQEKLKKALKEEKDEIKQKVREDFDQKLKAQKEEIEEKAKQLSQMRDKEIELERIKRKMEEQEKDMELKYEKKMRSVLVEKEEILAKRIQEEATMKLAEKDKQLADQNKLIEELKRKKDQGSMQLQGEVQELAIEEILRHNFPIDLINEVPKGIRGADTIQTVINSLRADCGKILYESKRTKTFSNDWLEKLRKDQREVGADIAVLITETMPKDMDTYGQKDGVWVCSFSEFVGLVHVLRHMIIKVYSIKSAQENIGDKKEVLYNYVSSEEFKQIVNGIVEGFSGMKTELDKEKRAMASIWKRREKQIEKVISNTINMHASIQGIAGNSISSLEILELGDSAEPLDE